MLVVACHSSNFVIGFLAWFITASSYGLFVLLLKQIIEQCQSHSVMSVMAFLSTAGCTTIVAANCVFWRADGLCADSDDILSGWKFW